MSGFEWALWVGVHGVARRGTGKHFRILDERKDWIYQHLSLCIERMIMIACMNELLSCPGYGIHASWDGVWDLGKAYGFGFEAIVDELEIT